MSIVKVLPRLRAGGGAQMAARRRPARDGRRGDRAAVHVGAAGALLGKFQEVATAVPGLPFDVVRRPSGGRAVLHGEASSGRSPWCSRPARSRRPAPRRRRRRTSSSPAPSPRRSARARRARWTARETPYQRVGALLRQRAAPRPAGRRREGRRRRPGAARRARAGARQRARAAPAATSWSRPSRRCSASPGRATDWPAPASRPRRRRSGDGDARGARGRAARRRRPRSRCDGMTEVDMTKILVLGGGPAGYVAAGRAAQLGAEVTRRRGARDRRHLPQPRLHPDQGDGGRRRAAARGAAVGGLRRAAGDVERSTSPPSWRARTPSTTQLRDGVAHLLKARKVEVARPRPRPRLRRRARPLRGSTTAASSRATPSSSPAAPSRCACGLFDCGDPRVMTSDELLRIDARARQPGSSSAAA